MIGVRRDGCIPLSLSRFEYVLSRAAAVRPQTDLPGHERCRRGARTLPPAAPALTGANPAQASGLGFSQCDLNAMKHLDEPILVILGKDGHPLLLASVYDQPKLMGDPQSIVGELYEKHAPV